MVISHRIESKNKEIYKVPWRATRFQSERVIFLSMEGCVTEEEYFRHISSLFEVRSKIKFISVVEDILKTTEKYRTPEQKDILCRVRPKQLVDRINKFKEQNPDYMFDSFPDDEFWIVTDVDKNWSNERINPIENKTFKEEWDEAIAECQKQGYYYAVSNPFFEIWLLLHHDEPSVQDKSFAVTDNHSYEKTNHFRQRLAELGAPLKNKSIKNICEKYKEKDIKVAVIRARKLHRDKKDLTPHYFATTVYFLLEKVVQMGESKN